MRRALAALALLLASSAPALAQGGGAAGEQCELAVDGERFSFVELPSGKRNVYFGGGVVARCPRQGRVIRSDSLESYGDEARHFFIGNVDYSDTRLRLKSDYLTYFQPDERLLAFMNVVATLPTGSTLQGSQLEFWRSIPGVRPQRANAVGRPTITIVERDSAGRPQPPVTVTGNTVWMEADSVVASSGDVRVVRPELTATGDSLFLDGGTGLLRLMRNPKVVGTRGRPFTLVGETIDVLSRQRRLERVLAKRAAEATSEDLNLKADTIDIRIGNDVLQRAIAWGASRARAVSPNQLVVADSIDVRMPDQKLREMHAVRGAIAEGAPDTTKFRTTERDRLTGDTIVAHFDTAAVRDSGAVRDTTGRPRIRLLVSTGHATSLQHLPPRDTALKRPAIVYVSGSDITVTFDTGTVRRVAVRDSARASGVYLEPDPDSTAGRRAAPGPSAAGTRVPGTPAAGTAGGPGSRAGGPARPPAPAPGSTPPPTGAPAPAPAVPPRRQ